MIIKLQWGLNPIPEHVKGAWGARAIMQNERLELLWDRQNFVVGDLSETEKDRFIDWINKNALPKLRNHIVERHWRGDSTELFSLSDGVFQCRATGNGSHGYCYISCWQENTLRE